MRDLAIFFRSILLFAGLFVPAVASAGVKEGWVRHHVDGAGASVEVPCTTEQVEQSLQNGPLAAKEGDNNTLLACSKDKDGIGFTVKSSDTSNENDSFANMTGTLPSGEAAGKAIVLPDGRKAYDVTMGRMLSVRFIETDGGGYIALTFFDILNGPQAAAHKKRFFNSVKFEGN